MKYYYLKLGRANQLLPGYVTLITKNALADLCFAGLGLIVLLFIQYFIS